MNPTNIFLEKDMYDKSYENLKSHYLKSDGWIITPQEHHGNYIPDYVIQRTTKEGIEKVVVEVKTCKVTQDDINQLNSYASKLAGGNAKILKKIFIVASGADTSLVDKSIFDIIYLKSFSCPIKRIVPSAKILYKK